MRKFAFSGFPLIIAAAAMVVYLGQPKRAVNAQTLALDRSLLALLPGDATTLAGFHIEQLKQTAAYRYFEENSRQQNPSGQNELDDFATLTGFDPRRDVQELLVASWPAPAGSAQNQSSPDANQGAPAPPNGNPEFVAVARGQFNIASITAAARLQGAASQNYRGFDLWSPARRAGPQKSLPRRGPGPRPGRREPQQGVLTFLDTTTALAGTRGAVMASIDRKLGGGPSLLDKTSLLARAQTISASSQVWAVSENPGEMIARAAPKAAGQNANFVRILSGMQNTTFALDLMNGLSLHAAGLCKSAEDAKTLADAARGLVAIGRLGTSQQRPEMTSLLDGVEVDQNNSEIDISVTVDAATFEKLLQNNRTRKSRAVRFERVN